MMKQLICFILTLVLLCASFSVLVVQASTTQNLTSTTVSTNEDIVFEDVADNFWGKADIDWAVENGITAGMTYTAFVPDGQLTRAQFVCFLSRLAEKMNFNVAFTQKEYPFVDVNPHVFYGTPANWAFEQGIVAGAGKNAQGRELFMPEQNITRQEMAVMMDRMLNGLLGVTLGPSDALQYPDAALLADWARSAAPTMQYTALIQGRPDGSFDPNGLATRAEAVAVVHRLYNLIIPKACTDQDGTNYDGTSRSRMFRLDMLNTYANEPNGVLMLNEGDAAAVGTGAYTCGRFTVTAAVEEDGQILLESPDAAEAFQSFDLSAYTEKDGNMHTYDLIWLDNNMYVFFVDGKEVHRIGDEYIAPVADTLPATLTLSGKMKVEQSAVYRYIDQSPFALHGALSTKGAYMIDENENIYQLNTLHVFNANQLLSYTSYETMKWIRDDWGIDGIRLGSVLDETGAHYDGFVVGTPENRETMMQNIHNAIQTATSLNMYIIVDWHGLDEWERYDKQPAPDGSVYSRADPNIYKEEALVFFASISEQYANHDNILYELYNEPLDGKAIYPNDFDSAYAYAWERIKQYATDIIDIIWDNDPNAMILLGTPSACQQITIPLSDSTFREKYENGYLMYTAHFYVGLHSDALYAQIVNAINGGLPIFITEFGIFCEDGGYLGSYTEADALSLQWWLDMIEQYRISNTYFLLLRGGDTDWRCILKASAVPETQYSQFTEEQMTMTGAYMHQWYRRLAHLNQG